MDTIANLISSIKTGYIAKKSKIEIPHSKFKEEVLKVLKKTDYIKNYKVIKEKKPTIVISLKYFKNIPSVTEIKQISKQGRRIYTKPNQLKPVLPLTKRGDDMGTTIISTSKGVMTAAQAKKEKVGGEIILTVY